MSAQIVTVVFLLLLSFFFSGSEAAMLYLSRRRIGRPQRSQVRAQGAIEALLADAPGLITTLLIGNEFVNVALASVTATIVVPLLGNAVGAPVAFCIAFTLLVLFGELTPKSLALRYPDDFAVAAVHPLRFLYRTLKPVRMVVHCITNVLLGSREGARESEKRGLSDEEFESLIEDGLVKGIYKQDEAQIMQRILALRRLTAKELMTPRPEVFAMSEQTTAAEATEALRERYFARIPVFSDSIDKIDGIVLAKDLIKAANSGRGSTKIKEFAREVLLVPETKKANSLLALLVMKRAHLAVVIDEYGGTEGIVSLEDILEEIVGEIFDEKDEETEEILRIGASTFRVLASARTDLFAQKVGFELPDGDYDTVGGFIVTKLGRIPVRGERLREGPLEFVVLRTEKSRVLSLLVRKLPSPSDRGDAE